MINKVHSRKQLSEWVSKQGVNYSKTVYQNSCNLNNLKNGVFFLLILQKIFPNQSSLIKSKIKEKPVTQYDFQKNILLVKKILNAYNLQMNMNVNQILKSKSCIDFLSWIKNLNDGNVCIPSQQPEKAEMQKATSPEKKYNLNSGYKTNRDSSSSKSGQKTLSQSKSNRNYSTSKSENPFYKVKSGKNLVEVNNKQLPVLDNNRSHVITQSKMKRSQYMSEFDSLDDCNQALYQIALEQSIQSFKNILQKVKENTSNTQYQETFQQYLNKINNSIFTRI